MKIFVIIIGENVMKISMTGLGIIQWRLNTYIEKLFSVYVKSSNVFNRQYRKLAIL
jgi:hypothetical protein